MARWRVLKSGSRCRVAIVAMALLAAALPGSALAAGGSGSIGGTLFDANGVPAGGVLVFACSGSCTYAISAANGAYSVGDLAPGSYRLGIEDGSGKLGGGYATATGITIAGASATRVPVGDAPVQFDIHATAGHLISGTITAAAGGPIADAFVEACVAAPNSLDEDFQACGFDSTAADGTYSLTVLPSSYRLYVIDFTGTHASGYYSTSGYVFAGRLAATLAAGVSDIAGIDAALPGGAAIAGTVTDSGGVPVTGMSVLSCLTTESTGCGFATTGADGSFSVTGLPAGAYRVTFEDSTAGHPTGYYSATGFTGDSGGATPVTVGASGASGIDVKLPGGHIASGVILDASGNPAHVEIDDCTTTFCIRVTTTGADGSYRINLAPGKHAIHAGDYSGANLSGYYSVAGLANSGHVTYLTIGSADLAGINLRLRRIVGSVHPGTAHSGKYATSTVVKKGTYATARFNLGKTFAGTRVAILRATKGSSGTWSTYRKVATVVVASDGYAYYSAKANGYMAFEAGEADSLVVGIQVLSAPVRVRGK